MVILSLDLKVSGEEVGSKIGNPTNIDSNANTEVEPKKPQPIQTHSGKYKNAIVVIVISEDYCKYIGNSLHYNIC